MTTAKHTFHVTSIPHSISGYGTESRLLTSSRELRKRLSAEEVLQDRWLTRAAREASQNAAFLQIVAAALHKVKVCL